MGAQRRIWPTVVHGQDTVSTSGTAVQLNGGTSQHIPNGAALVVRANGGNAGVIYVGDSSVSSSNGFELAAGESVSLHVDDVDAVWIDAASGGDGVSWIVEAE